MNVNFNYRLPSPFAEATLPGKFTAGWSLTGIVIAQSGQPYSVVDYSGSSGSIYFSTYNGITNAVVPLAPGCTAKSARTGKSGAFGTPALKASCFTVPLLTGAAATSFGVPGPSTDAPLGDIYETTFPSGQRNIFRQSAQKRADVSLVKETQAFDRYSLRYTFDVFNLTNTSSFDVPNAQTTQNSSYNPLPSAEQTVLTSSTVRRAMSVTCSTPSAVGARYRCRLSFLSRYAADRETAEVFVRCGVADRGEYNGTWADGCAEGGIPGFAGPPDAVLAEG